MIGQTNYATLNINLNISSIFDETRQIFKAANAMNVCYRGRTRHQLYIGNKKMLHITAKTDQISQWIKQEKVDFSKVSNEVWCNSQGHSQKNFMGEAILGKRFHRGGGPSWPKKFIVLAKKKIGL